MAYIETHQSLLTHRKTLRLGRLLGMDRFCAVGRLVALWGWALDNAPDGAVAVADTDILADVMGWEGDPAHLCEALVTAGFFDRAEGFYLLHDWYVYAGKLIEKRQQNAERMRNARAKPRGEEQGEEQGERAEHVQRTFYARAEANVPNRTLPDLSPSDSSRNLPSPACAQDAELAAVPPPPSAPVVASAENPVVPLPEGNHPDVSEPPEPSEPSEPQAANPAPKLKLVYADDSIPMQLARTLGAGIHRHKPDAKLPRGAEAWQAWAREFDLALRIDHRPREKIEAVIVYAMHSSFWRGVIFSARKLREKFDVLDSQRLEDANGGRRQAGGQTGGTGNGSNGRSYRGSNGGGYGGGYTGQRLPTQDEYRAYARRVAERQRGQPSFADTDGGDEGGDEGEAERDATPEPGEPGEPGHQGFPPARAAAS